MLSLIICGLAVAAVVSGQDDCTSFPCDDHHIHFNTEKLCVAVMEERYCCPTSFNCPSIEDHSKCHVRGQAYDIGTHLTSEQVGDKCVAECTCRADAEDSTKAHLDCARIECPEVLGVPPPPGCFFTYSHDQCCHVGITCDNATDDSTPFTCQHGDHSHRIGEKFHPDDHPCKECICMEGYDGTVKEPWCKTLNCGVQHRHHEGCSPVYSPGRCCPTDWRCPKQDESMTISSTSPPTPGEPTCIYGTHRLSMGDWLTWEDDTCVECKCRIPPYLSCARTKETVNCTLVNVEE